MTRVSLRPAVVLSVSAALAVAGAAHASAASGTANPYDPAYQHAYRHGVLPTISQLSLMKQWAATAGPAAQAVGTETLSYGGGIDGIGVGSGAKNKVYLVFYGSQWGAQGTNGAGDATFSGDPSGAAPVAQEMFKGIGTGGELWSADLTQWCDGPGVTSGVTACPAGLPASQFIPYQSGGVLSGVWYDNAAASPAAATQAQLAQVAVSAAAHFGNTTAASNRNAYYVVLSPTGTNPDNYKGQFCAWHDYTTSAYGDLAYSNQPYNIDAGASCGVGFLNSPGTFDGWTMTLGHEWHEQMSDQNPLGGWSNHTGSSSNGQENSDECAWLSAGTPGGAANVTMGSGTFAEQSSWSNDTNACAMSHPVVGHGTGDTVTVAAIAGQSWQAGTAASLQASGSSSAGKALSWSATGLPAGLSINAASGLISGTPTTAGSGTATVTGSDNTPASGSTGFSWTVAAATAESVAVTNPGAQTGIAGNAVSLQIQATDSAGKALTYSASGLPAGLSINASTGLISGTPTTAGSSSVTVTASSGTASGSASFGWTVNPAPSGGGIVNGGFETGTFSGWTTSGASETVLRGFSHSGVYSAELGSASATAGDSSAAQTFTVPSGSNLLSFWYDNVCPDTVQYDWATATLRDTTTGTTSTMLARTCSANSGWRQAAAAVVAGHSYTLTLTSHDDNAPGDPTYTLFDDVALSVAAPSPIVNGGFETGDLSGWTPSGAAASVVSSGAHSGTRAAMLGRTSATNGDSTIAQTFTASNGGTLSFWDNVSCDDTVQYDWATATLRDNSTGVTTRILARTCPSTSGWRQVSAAVAAGHSYTLALTNHDDGNPGDPTYTLFDDVTVTGAAAGTTAGPTGTAPVWCVFGPEVAVERRVL